jgi:TPR repeat protein
MLLVMWLLLVGLVGAAVAGPFKDGFKAYKRGDYAEAVRLWRKAAEQGDATAQFNLGNMYGDGRSVSQDYIQAHKWFNLAASRFSASEAEGRARAVGNRVFVAAKMTAAQVAEAQRLAREWWPK